MKKIPLLLSLALLGGAALAGCSKPYQTPTTPYDKVVTAFSGVEKSFKNLSAGSKSAFLPKQRLNQPDMNGALSDIDAIYVPGDTDGDSLEGLSYTEPPMIQFQCLKKALDSLGASYSFGTKYFDTVTGDVYYDPFTGQERPGEDEMKCQYEFTMGLEIRIDANDLINADVSFDITLRKGEESYRSQWCVAMVLDYEMEKENPTYTLSMYTDNRQGELPCMQYGNVYEYDYVDMRDGAIREWRKFDYETNKMMIKDANHGSFASYAGEADFLRRVGVCRWFKNGSLRFIHQEDASRRDRICTALFDKMGLNVTDLGGDAFLQKQGTRNAVIQNMYREFSALFGKDVIYSLITKSPDHVDVATPKEVVLMNQEGTSRFDSIKMEGNYPIDAVIGGGDRPYALWIIDTNEAPMRKIENMESLAAKLVFTSNDGYQYSLVDDVLSTPIADLLKEGISKEAFEKRPNIVLALGYPELSSGLQIKIELGDGLREEIEKRYRQSFPTEVEELGFLPYSGNECTYEYLTNGVSHQLIVKNSDELELKDYWETYGRAQWTCKREDFDGNGRYIDKTSFFKEKDGKILTISNVGADNKDGTFVFELSIADIPEGDPWPGSEIEERSNHVLTLQEPRTVAGHFAVDLEAGKIELIDFTDDEKQNFVFQLGACSDLGYAEKSAPFGDTGVYILKAGKFYRFEYQDDGRTVYFYFDVNEDNTFPMVNEFRIERDFEGQLHLVGDLVITSAGNGYWASVQLSEGDYCVTSHSDDEENKTFHGIENHMEGPGRTKIEIVQEKGRTVLRIHQTTMLHFFASASNPSTVLLVDSEFFQS